MKLYLSSYRIPTPADLEDLVGKPFADTRVALVSNAKDYYIPRAREIKVQDSKDYFAGLGVETISEVDLRQYNDADELEKALRGHDMVWAMGGNTFMLRYEMKRSGFDAVIRKLLAEGVVYAGESAGAIVAGTDLIGIDLSDDSRFSEAVIMDGMALVAKFISTHTDNPMYAENSAESEAMHDPDTVVSLKDSEAYVVDDAEARIASGSVAS